MTSPSESQPEELLSHSDTVSDEGTEFRVVDLPTLIEIKKKTGGLAWGRGASTRGLRSTNSWPRAHWLPPLPCTSSIKGDAASSQFGKDSPSPTKIICAAIAVSSSPQIRV